jgi:DNA polymerase-3 subunit alpha
MYLIFDTETTGLPSNYNAPVTDTNNWPRVVQLAWQLHNNIGECIEAHNFIIRPDGFTIPYNAEQIHGISTERALKSGIPFSEVFDKFNQAVANSEFAVGHNIEFDIKVLLCEAFRYQLSSDLDKKTITDTKTDKSANFVAIPGGRAGKFKWPTLQELYKKVFNETFEEAHNASADVEATARVFLEMLRTGIYDHSDLHRKQDFLKDFIEKNTTPFQLIGLNVKPYEKEQSSNEEHKLDLTSTPTQNNKDLLKRLENVPFFHLRNHTQFSVLQSTTDLKQLISLAAKFNMPAIGICDIGNMMGAFHFVKGISGYNKEIQGKRKEAEATGSPFSNREIIPILGCELHLCKNHNDKQQKDNGFRIPFFAKNKNGYHNLARLSSAGYIEGFYYVPRIDRELLLKYKQDLIVTTGGLEGEVPRTILNIGEQQGEERLLWWKEQFGDDFYIEINRHHLPEENRLNQILLSFAKKHDIKIIASNNTYYLHKEDAVAHDILLCIKENEKQSTPIGNGRGYRFGFPNDEFWFKGQNEMKELFSDLPEAIENLSELLQKIETFPLEREVLLPRFEIPENFIHHEDETDGGKRGENAYLKHLAYEGAIKRYGTVTEEIKARLDFELETIERTGYPGYFLIVQDFCAAARNMGVSVGPGRGSAAGSAVAYCIGITNVDPIKYDLLFERFLNPERVSLPDIDIDFDDEGRGKVIEYVINKYGSSQVAQIITYGTMAAKSAVRDTGRVLELSLQETGIIANMIPDATLKEITGMKPEEVSKLFPPDRMQKGDINALLEITQDPGPKGQVLRTAAKIEGCLRNSGIHACGVIITPSDIREHIPVTLAKDSDMWVTQFDNSVVENAGLLKMDFLGLKTLTLIKDAVGIVKEKHGIEIDPDSIPLDDPKTYELFQRGETIGIFQYESAGMQKYLKQLKPTEFGDLIAMNALYRPGPLEYIPNFIARKHGTEPIVYDLPEMEEYLAETYGITVYQEQVMLLSQKLANFTKGMADSLRKGMGKKVKKVIDEMFPKFIEGGKENGHPEDVLRKIWQSWEAFASYAFNKSHSTCYAYVAFQTAYFKANYPAEYMASVLSNNMNDIKQVTFFMEECRRMGIKVLGPDINESNLKFTVNAQGEIRFSLGAIKGVGEAAVRSILEDRKNNGAFQSIFDMVKRIDQRTCNRKVLESLACAGALDRFSNYNRALYFAEEGNGIFLDKVIRYGQSSKASGNSAQVSIFDDTQDIAIPEPALPAVADWPTMFKLNKEREAVGLFLSGHPLDDFRQEMERFCNVTLAQISNPEDLVNKEIRTGGMITGVNNGMSRRNNAPYCFLTVEDYEGSYEFKFFNEQYLKWRHFFVENTFVYIEMKINKKQYKDNPPFYEYSYPVIEPLHTIREKKSKALQISLPLTLITEENVTALQDIMSAHSGPLKTNFRIYDIEEKIDISMPMKSGGLRPDDTLFEALEKLTEQGLIYKILT